ncbi:hypothetical protein BC835DRAFT_1520594 [Cytidiella melzeri]|nr:hypothetical protein BC835DRAFT_1520594 [Cytidiella melzeri]
MATLIVPSSHNLHLQPLLTSCEFHPPVELSLAHKHLSMPVVEVVLASGILTLGLGIIDLTRSRKSAHNDALSKLDKIKTYLDDMAKELAALEEQDRSGPYHFDDVAPELRVVGPNQLRTDLRELELYHDDYREKLIDYGSSARPSRLATFFTNKGAETAAFFAEVDDLLAQVNQLQKDCIVTTRTLRERLEKAHDADSAQHTDAADGGPTSRTPTNATFNFGVQPSGYRRS